MIKFQDIGDSLADLIKIKAGLNLLVSFNDVADAAKNYVFVRLRPARTDLGWGFFDRSIRIDLQFHISPNGFGEIRHSDYYEIIDKLDAATLHCVKIAERFLPVYDTSTIIFDNIMTYSFRLDFTDAWDEIPLEERGKLMRHLHLNLKGRYGPQDLQHSTNENQRGSG